MDQALLFKYYTQVLGDHWQLNRPVMLSGFDVVESLWVLNEKFKENYVKFRSIPYSPKFETHADDALQRFVFTGSWGLMSAETLRVILERHQQALVVALKNQAAGNPLMPIPEGLPEGARTGAVILFLLQQMKLPFPIGDRAGYEPDQH